MTVQRFKNVQHLLLLLRHPGPFIKKAWKKIRGLWTGFFIDTTTRRFIEHSKKLWSDWLDPDVDGVVLVSWDWILESNVLMLYLANVIAKKKKSRIYTFAARPWPLARALRAVYRSFNVSGHVIQSKLTASQKAMVDKLYNEIILTLKAKEDVFHLKIHDIHVGVDIYETYMREFHKPTVVLDQALFSVLRQALEYLIFWEDYFERNRVAGLIVSHDAYLNYNVACKVAYKNKVPVYTPVGLGALGLLKQAYDSYSFLYSYKAWFADLSQQEQKDARELAQKQLEKRFSGEVGGDLSYVTDSAFSAQPDPPKVIRPSEKFKVLICSHCFYDMPHCYGGMIFIDFYEWLKYLLKIAEKTEYDWYLKMHPKPLPGTLEIIKEILGNSSRITILPSATSHHQLAKEGINCVLTVYGSVGHEYPLLDVQVVNAGFNPHAAYDFTWTPKSLKEYEYFILHLQDLKKDIRKEDLFEFYFMNYYYRAIDDLVYHSYRGIYKELSFDQRLNSSLYAYLLKGWSEEKHKESLCRLGDFVDSGKQYFFFKGPVDPKAWRPKDVDYLC